MKRVCAECGTDLDDWQEVTSFNRLWNLIVVACTVVLLALIAAIYFSPNAAEKCALACGSRKVATWQPEQGDDNGNLKLREVCTCMEAK